jgi:hypothetical protein
MASSVWRPRHPVSTVDIPNSLRMGCLGVWPTARSCYTLFTRAFSSTCGAASCCRLCQNVARHVDTADTADTPKLGKKHGVVNSTPRGAIAHRGKTCFTAHAASPGTRLGGPSWQRVLPRTATYAEKEGPLLAPRKCSTSEHRSTDALCSVKVVCSHVFVNSLLRFLPADCYRFCQQSATVFTALCNSRPTVANFYAPDSRSVRQLSRERRRI